jgi:lipopolysaccharide biosynthesis regulator YciM
MPMTELLFLLLPLAFYSGWHAARKRYRNRQKPQQKNLASHFVKGINYLLNEEPDKALNFFLNHADIDEYTAETFLLLGNSFRNRGEVDRALKVHQNLMARPNLNRPQKEAAMMALGKDFLAAGMLDRAEKVFKELLTTKPKNAAEAYLSLRQIYEQLKDWPQAIEVTQGIENKAKSQQLRIVAHYYCEMASAELTKGNLYLVEDYLNQAKKSYKNLARIKIIQGDVAVYEENYSKALKIYQVVISDDAQLIGMLFNTLIKVADKTGGCEKIYKFLMQHYKKSYDINILEHLLKLAYKTNQYNDELKQILEEDLRTKKLSVYSILKSTQLLAHLAEQTEDKQALKLIEQALHNHLVDQLHFRCQHCGYKMNEYLWRCPVCHHWDTISKLQ